MGGPVASKRERAESDGGREGSSGSPEQLASLTPLRGIAALWVVIVTALASAFDYFRRYNVVLNPRIADLAAASGLRSDNRKAS